MIIHRTSNPADETVEPGSGSTFLAYLQLIRAPNVFTSIADIAMGFLVVSSSLEPWWQFAALALASAAMYSAGMVLNDVFDFHVDSQLRPQRPLPSRRISRVLAARLGYTLLFLGASFAATVGFVARWESHNPWRSGAVAGLLMAAIYLYDGLLKTTVLGPWLMGSCRFLNVLLGMSLGDPPGFDQSHLLGYTLFQLAIAGGIGIYITGVTWFARREAEHSPRLQLGFGLGLMVLGVALLGAAPQWAADAAGLRYNPTYVWPLILFLLTFPILRRCLVAIAAPFPNQVQSAVKLSILSLIILDAAVVLLTSDWYWAVGIVALLVPTILLRRWVYST
jgi:4-hydroxybenzoate polyprenyltransferase